MEKLFKQYAFLAQIVAFVAAAITGVVSGGIHGIVEWAIVITALANAINVFVTPNLTAGVGRFAKGITAVALAVAGALTPAVVANGLDAHTVWMLIEVGVGALLAFTPNGGYRFAVKRGQVREPVQAA
jgi:hypothetical protein